MAVRKVVTRSGLHIRGHFPSYKMGRMVSWESQLERKCIWHLEYSPAVRAYEEQPATLHFCDGAGKQRRAVPDFGVQLHDGRRLLIEVKPAAKLLSSELRERLARVGVTANAQGYEYKIVTDRDLNKEPLLTNLQDILRHRPPRCDFPHYQSLLSKLPQSEMTVAAAAELVGGVATLKCMQALHLLAIDIRAPFSPDLQVHLSGENHEFLL